MYQLLLHACSFFLQLHATMMNTAYRRDKSQGMTFDAREIHKKFGKKDWGKYLITEAQISQRSWYDSRGYYHCCGSLPFPHEWHWKRSISNPQVFVVGNWWILCQNYDQWYCQICNMCVYVIISICNCSGLWYYNVVIKWFAILSKQK